MTTTPAPDPLIDAFIAALWVEDGLSANTLAAYRRDLTLLSQWLAATSQHSLANAGE
ncbi:MAG TPA: site-specific integrase, partial [Ideonella sp.]|nr:site-specific integrase [Ideonella sp.]